MVTYIYHWYNNILSRISPLFIAGGGGYIIDNIEGNDFTEYCRLRKSIESTENVKIAKSYAFTTTKDLYNQEKYPIGIRLNKKCGGDTSHFFEISNPENYLIEKSEAALIYKSQEEETEEIDFSQIDNINVSFTISKETYFNKYFVLNFLEVSDSTNEIIFDNIISSTDRDGNLIYSYGMAFEPRENFNLTCYTYIFKK